MELERVFTDTIRKADGGVKFAKGEVKYFPRETWDTLSKTVGRKVDQFSAGISELARDTATKARDMVEQTAGRKMVEETDTKPTIARRRPKET